MGKKIGFMKSMIFSHIGFIALVTSLSFSSCSNEQPEKQETHAQESTPTDTGSMEINHEVIRELKTSLVDGFRFNATVKLADTVSCLVLSNQEQFDHYFLPSKISKDKSMKIDFKTLRIAAIVYQASKSKIEIKLGASEVKGNQAIIHFEISRGAKQHTEANSFTLFSIPNDSDIQSITFLQGDQAIYSYYFADAD
jgi:hypothetical protein